MIWRVLTGSLAAVVAVASLMAAAARAADPEATPAASLSYPVAVRGEVVDD